MILRTLAGLVLAAAASPLAGQTATAPAPAASATTTVTPGQAAMVEDLLVALNAGGGAPLDAWIARHAVIKPTKAVDVWQDWFGRIARTARPLALERIDSPTAAGELRIWLRAGDQRLARRIGLFVDTVTPDRAQDFIIAVWPSTFDGTTITAPATNAALADLLRARVAFGAARDEFSGAAMLANRRQVVGQAVAGLANRQSGEANVAGTRFHIGSMGKMFTAVAVAKLIERKQLAFTTTLGEVLPQLVAGKPAAAITIAQLLSHSSGISLPPGGPTFEDDPRKVSDAAPAILAVPLVYEPGTKAQYSNEGYTILGAVIEAVTGRSYYDVVQSVVFDPAGMKHTAFDTEPPVRGTAIGYRYGEEDALGVRPREANSAFVKGRGGPSGGAYSTIADLTAFLNAFRDGRLLAPALVEALLTAEPNGWRRYGKGFQVIPVRDRKVVGHTGGGPNSGINADAMIVWETGWSYAVAGNYDAPAAQSVAGPLFTAIAWQPAAP